MWTPELRRQVFHAVWDDGSELGARYRGTQILKQPYDLWCVQEIIFATQVEVIVETGTWMGASACYYADLGVEVHTVDLAKPCAPPAHPLVTYYHGYSTAPTVRYRMGEACRDRRTMVILDSDHHKENVLAELEAYAPLVTPGCYLIVEDTHLGWWTGFEEFPDGGPKAALDEWLPAHPEFEVVEVWEQYGVTMHPGGWLRRLEEVNV